MKRLKRSKVKLRKSLDILVSYQAYCMCTGFEHKSFAEALRDKYARKVISRYCRMLSEVRGGMEEEYSCISRTIRLIPYAMNGESLAYMFISINRYLQGLYDAMCVLSWYDMKSMISAIEKQKEIVQVTEYGKISFNDVSSDYIALVKEVICNSVYDISRLEEMCEQDSILQPIALWLFSDRCEIRNNNIVSTVLTSCDNKRVYPRENTVFTKLLLEYRMDEYYSYARKYDYDNIDRVASLLFSLPAYSMNRYKIPEDATFRNISSFIERYSNCSGYKNKNVSLAHADNERAIRIRDLCAAVRYDRATDMIIMSVANKECAYVFHVIGSQLMDFRDNYEVVPHLMEPIGKAISCAIARSPSKSLETLVERLLRYKSSDTLNKILGDQD